MTELENLQEQLKNVRAAIASIETGAQSYKLANRSIAKADLATLYARETSLKAAIARETGGDLYFAEIGRL